MERLNNSLNLWFKLPRNCPDCSFYVCLILDVCEVKYQKDRTEDMVCYILTSGGVSHDKQFPVSWLHFVSTWPNVCGSMLGLLKHGILITVHNSFKYVCVCVCAWVCTCAQYRTRPEEGVRYPHTQVTGSCEPSAITAEKQISLLQD